MDPARATGEDHLKSEGLEPYGHGEKDSFMTKVKDFFKNLIRKKF